MEDALTDIPPPSRFFHEDLNNFTPPSPPLPNPFFVFSNPNPNPNSPLRPSLLIVAISSPSTYLFHRCISSKTLIGTLILPEVSLSGNSIEPSPTDKSCNIYALDDDRSIVFVSVQFSVAAERSHAVAKLLIGEHICPERVVILDSLQSRTFRGKLSPDETFAFKLHTSKSWEQQQELGSTVRGLEYFPSGSVMDGLPAALLARCQMRKIKGTLCVSWPESDGSAVSLVKSILKDVLPSLDLSVYGHDDADAGFYRFIRDTRPDSELYT